MGFFYWSIKVHGFQMLINKNYGVIFVDQHPDGEIWRYVLLINKKKSGFFYWSIKRASFICWSINLVVLDSLNFCSFLCVWPLQFLDCPLKLYCPTARSGLHLCLYTAVRLVIVHHSLLLFTKSLLLFETFLYDWCHMFHHVSHVVFMIHIVYVLR